MRILHIVAYLPPERVGGVGEFVSQLHQELGQRGHHSLVLTAGRRSSPGVRRIARSRLGWFLGVASWAKAASEYDIVHGQSGEAVLLLAALAMRRRILGGRGPRTLTTFHVTAAGIAAAHRPYEVEGQWLGRELRSALYGSVVGWLRGLADRVALALSDAVNFTNARCAHDLLGPSRARRASVIPYGLPEAPPGAEAPPPRCELLFVGVGGHRKRVNALPGILERVRSLCEGACLRIVGFDPESEPLLLEELSRRQLLSEVEFAGVWVSSDLDRFYANAGVLVVPSAYEGLPLVILEAMRSGLPVVATDVGGHSEAIEHAVNGFLVPADGFREMADRCAQVLLDPALREAMSGATRKTFAERFRLDREVDRYLELYRRLVASPAEPRSVASRSTREAPVDG